MNPCQIVFFFKLLLLFEMVFSCCYSPFLSRKSLVFFNFSSALDLCTLRTAKRHSLHFEFLYSKSVFDQLTIPVTFSRQQKEENINHFFNPFLTLLTVFSEPKSTLVKLVFIDFSFVLKFFNLMSVPINAR